MVYIFIDFIVDIGSTTVHLKEVVVMDPEGFSVGDGEEGDSEFATLVVHRPFHIDGDCRSAFIENSELWSMIEQSGHLEIKN